MKKHIYICMLANLIAFFVVAQELDFQEVVMPQDPISIAGVTQSEMAFADIDGDNDRDVLITGLDINEEPFTGLYINDGSGIYSLVEDTPFHDVYYGSIVFSDIDGDNDLDVLITGLDDEDVAVTELYTNNGEGVFSVLADVPFPDVYKSAIAFADIDGDDDQDVLISGSKGLNFDEGITKLYLNDGSGVFSFVLGTPFIDSMEGVVAFADVDGDNDQDVMISDYSDGDSNACVLYINNGEGDFSASTDSYFDEYYGGYFAFADVDGDNDQDVLITGGQSSYPSRLYLNDGTGIFTYATGSSFPYVEFASVAFGDVDNDGDLDLAIAGKGYLYYTISELYINDGLGNYTPSTSSYLIPVSNGAIGFDDIDGDNDLDLIITGFNTGSNDEYLYKSEVYRNDGLGNFLIEGNIPLKEVGSGTVAFADIDGDNDQDLLITGKDSSNGDDYVSNLYNNDGTGFFTLIPFTPFPGIIHSHIAFADVDGDNDLDLFITGVNQGESICELYFNDGLGNYTLAENTPFEGLYRGAMAFADVDGDSDLDLIITGSQGDLRITEMYTNDGTGAFTLVEDTPFIDVNYSNVVFADIDNDNDMDVLISGRYVDGRITSLYTNDGSGSYSLVSETDFVGIANGSLVFTDIDNDADLDIFVAGSTYISTGVCYLYINDGLGNFSANLEVPFANFNSSVNVIDFDGDNDQDVLIITEESIDIYVNDGLGEFSLVPDMPFQALDYMNPSAVADIDNDNNPDVLLFGDLVNPTMTLWRNTINCTPTAGVENSIICGDESIIVNGNTYNAMNSIGSEVIVNGAANGCDSTVTIDLIVLPEMSGVEDATLCFGESILVNGTVYDASNPSGIEIIEGGAANGCDSVVDVSLTILPYVFVSQDINELTVSNNNASYQWLDCDNNYSPITGETNQTFTPTVNGSYAVEVTENGCVKISDCIAINTIGLFENNKSAFLVHPNPNQGEFSITFKSLLSQVEISILDLQGRLISAFTYNNIDVVNLSIDEPEGIYIVHINTTQYRQSFQVVKK